MEAGGEPRWQAWEGKNRFLFGGRIMLGSDANHFFVTIFMTTLPIALLIALVLPSLKNLGAQVFPLLSTVLCCLLGATLYYLTCAALTEPGIIPRNPKHVTVPPPIVEGDSHHMIDIKYCTTCNVYRPPRAKHCSYCDNCVARFDHHCPWTGNCVGLRNYHFFIGFVSWVNTLAISTLCICIACLFERTHSAGQAGSQVTDFVTNSTHGTHSGSGGSNFLSAINSVPGAASLGIGAYALITLFSTLGLLVFHFRLIFINQTTNELLRGTYKRQINPFNRGCARNSCSILCPKRIASNLQNMRSLVPPAEMVPSVSEVGHFSSMVPSAEAYQTIHVDYIPSNPAVSTSHGGTSVDIIGDASASSCQSVGPSASGTIMGNTESHAKSGNQP